jgi:hypothetical protein
MPGRPTGGPSRPAARLAWCLLPLLTLGLLGMVPALVLAFRRRRPVDTLGAVAAVLVEATFYVCLAVVPGDSQSSGALLGGSTGILLLVGAPLHFLLMDRRSQWPVQAPPVQASPVPAPFVQVPPVWPPAPADDLQQLGELLRRQAQEGRE